MHDKITKLLTAKRISFHKIDGIKVCSVSDSQQGLELAKEILYETVDRQTALYLSGGNSLRPLYESLAWEENLIPGVVGLIDERFGEPMHDASNEKMIVQTGMVRYLSMRDIPYYSILHGVSIGQTSQRYDELYRSLGSVYRKSIGILGIGTDGHTAGIAPERPDFHNPLFDTENQYDMVSWFDDDLGPAKKRVTMTFLGLSMLDFLLILVFGGGKKKALESMFGGGKEEDLPSRFYKRADVSPKTLLITDQKVYTTSPRLNRGYEVLYFVF